MYGIEGIYHSIPIIVNSLQQVQLTKKSKIQLVHETPETCHSITFYSLKKKVIFCYQQDVCFIKEACDWIWLISSDWFGPFDSQMRSDLVFKWIWYWLTCPWTDLLWSHDIDHHMACSGEVKFWSVDWAVICLPLLQSFWRIVRNSMNSQIILVICSLTCTQLKLNNSKVPLVKGENIQCRNCYVILSEFSGEFRAYYFIFMFTKVYVKNMNFVQ